MMEQATGVIGGVDCHSRTHHAVVLDYRGRQLGDAEFPATAVGYRALHRWMASFGEVQAVGAESTSAYGAALTRWLTSNGVRVLEVNQPHKHLRSRKGKSDPIDAEAAARRVLAGEVRVIPKDTTGVVESIRQLRVAREGALKARSAALCQLGDLLVTAPPELRESLTRKTLKGQARLCAKLRPDVRRLSQPLQAAKFALRSLARRVADLDEEIDQLDQELRTLVRQAAPRTTELLGVGIQHAGQLLVTAGENIERLRSEAAFAPTSAPQLRFRLRRASPSGTASIPAATGRRTAHST